MQYLAPGYVSDVEGEQAPVAQSTKDYRAPRLVEKDPVLLRGVVEYSLLSIGSSPHNHHKWLKERWLLHRVRRSGCRRYSRHFSQDCSLVFLNPSEPVSAQCLKHSRSSTTYKAARYDFVI